MSNTNAVIPSKAKVEDGKTYYRFSWLDRNLEPVTVLRETEHYWFILESDHWNKGKTFERKLAKSSADARLFKTKTEAYEYEIAQTQDKIKARKEQIQDLQGKLAGYCALLGEARDEEAMCREVKK